MAYAKSGGLTVIRQAECTFQKVPAISDSSVALADMQGAIEEELTKHDRCPHSARSSSPV